MLGLSRDKADLRRLASRNLGEVGSLGRRLAGGDIGAVQDGIPHALEPVEGGVLDGGFRNAPGHGKAFVSTGPHTAIESGFLQHLEGLRVG